MLKNGKIKNDRNKVNEIFKNIIKKIIGNYSPLCSRYKFLNAFWMLEKINNQLISYKQNKKRIRLGSIILLFDFTIMIIENEKYIDPTYKDFIPKLNNFKSKINNNIFNQDDIDSLINDLKILKENKKDYCQKSYKKLKSIYNNWEIKSISDIEKINNSIFHFISTRLMWGFSWRKIKSKLKQFSNNENFWNLDFIESILELQVKHPRAEYTIFIPIDTSLIDDEQIWITNFNKINKNTQILESTQVEEEIENKTARNLQKLDLKKRYIKYKTLQLDDYSAIDEVLKRVLPTKLGRISALKKSFIFSKETPIIVTSQWDEKQYFNAINYNELELSSPFLNDLVIIPELKYINSNSDMNSIWKNIFSLIYHNEARISVEHKYMDVYLLLENSERLIKSLNFKLDPHEILLWIANIDVLIEYYINNAFAIKKYFTNMKNKKYKNDLEYLEDYINNKEDYKNCIDEYTQRNIAPNDLEKKLIHKSLEYFKDLAAQTRHKIMHEGKKTDFFDHLIIETLDSILTLSILRVFNKQLKSESKVNEQYTWLEEAIEKNNFEKLKKVL